MVKAYFHIVANGKDITDRVKSFDYEMCSEKDNMLTIKIKPEFSLITIDDEDLNVNNTVEFYWGWVNGKISPVKFAKITDIETDYDRTHVTMTIKCLDKGNRSKKTSSPKIWKNVKLSDIVKSIAEKNKLNYDIQPTKKVWASVPQANKSDYEFIQYMVRKEPPGNWIFFFEGESLFLQQRDIGRNADYLFEWNKSDSGIFYIRPAYRESSQDASTSQSVTATFDPETLKTTIIEATQVDESTGLFSYNMNGEEQGVGLDNKATANKLDKLKKQLSIAEQTAKTPQEKQQLQVLKTAATQVASGVISGREIPEEYVESINNLNFIPGGDIGEANSFASSIAEESKLKVLEVDISKMGDPQYKPHDIFTLTGVAKKHGGNWYIKDVTHSIPAAGDYTVKITGSKNGTNKPMNNITSENIDVNKSVGDANADNEVEKFEYDGNGNRVGETGLTGSWRK